MDVILFLISFVISDSFSLYTSEFMEIEIGAKAMGVGGAYVGIADDPTAFYWNPGGLVNIKERMLFFMHSSRYDTVVSINTIAMVQPRGKTTVSVAVYWLTVPNIPISETLYVIKEWVTTKDYVTYFSYAKEINIGKVGVNVKLIYRDWKITTAYGLESDVGILTKWKNINLGVNLVNLLGTKITYSDRKTKPHHLPFTLKVGLSSSTSIFRRPLIVGLGFDIKTNKEVTQYKTYPLDSHFGMDYQVHPRFAIRCGWNRKEFTGGIGFSYHTLNVDLGLITTELGLAKQISGYIRL
jgi:hypothetical protein